MRECLPPEGRHPQGVVLSQAAVTEAFADRPLRTATSLASAWYAEDFVMEFSDERNFTAPNLAVMGWTKKQPTYVAAYATAVRWDAGRRELSYDLEQSPEQAGTQSLGGRRAAQAARQGGTAKLRKCAVFVDGALHPLIPCSEAERAIAYPDGICGFPVRSCKCYARHVCLGNCTCGDIPARECLDLDRNLDEAGLPVQLLCYKVCPPPEQSGVPKSG